MGAQLLTGVAALVFWQRLQPTGNEAAEFSSPREIAHGVPQGESATKRTGRTAAEMKAADVRDPEMRETTTRWVSRNYAPLFAQLNLSPEKQDLLERILVDWMLGGFEGRAENDRLAAELLTPREFEALLAHRVEMRVKGVVDSAVTTVGVAGLAEGDPVRQAVEKVVRAAPLRSDGIWQDAARQLERGGPLSEANLATLAATASQRFESVLSTGAEQLSPEQMRMLRAWFQKEVVDFELGALRPRQPRGR